MPEREPLKTFVSSKCPGGSITPKEEMIYLVVLFLLFFYQISTNPKQMLTEVMKYLCLHIPVSYYVFGSIFMLLVETRANKVFLCRRKSKKAQ